MRLFIDPDTRERFAVRLAPRGRMGGRGIHPRVSSLEFETEAGEWVGEVPVFAPFRLHETAERNLQVMLERAKRREL